MLASASAHMRAPWLTCACACCGASLCASQGLLDYLFACCQVRHGGLRDKPGRGRDYYHTCYCLSGLAVANAEPRNETAGEAPKTPAHWRAALGFVHPVYNISAPKAEAAEAFWKGKPL